MLKLYNVLIQTRLTRSKTKRDIQYSKLGIRVASRVAGRGGVLCPHKKKTRLRILGKFKFGWRHSPAPSPSQKLNSASSSQRTCKSRYQTSLALSSFTGPLYPVPNTLPRAVVQQRSENDIFLDATIFLATDVFRLLL